eukprot:RCo002822
MPLAALLRRRTKNFATLVRTFTHEYNRGAVALASIVLFLGVVLTLVCTPGTGAALGKVQLPFFCWFRDFVKSTPTTRGLRRWLLCCMLILGSFLLYPALQEAFRWLSNRLRKVRGFYGALVDASRRPVLCFALVAAVSLFRHLLSSSEAGEYDDLTDILKDLPDSALILILAHLLSNVFHCTIAEFVDPLLASRLRDSDGGVAPSTHVVLDDQVVAVLRLGVTFLIWSTAWRAVAHLHGVSLNAVLYGMGAGGLAFALAAKETLSNLMAAAVLFFDKPFEIGDRVRIRGRDGKVVDVGVRSTRLKLLDGRLLVLPNSEVANAEVENVSSEPSRRARMDLRVSYCTPAEVLSAAMAEVQNALEADPELAEGSTCLVAEADEKGILVRSTVFIRKDVRSILATQSRVFLVILGILQRNNVQCVNQGNVAKCSGLPPQG